MVINMKPPKYPRPKSIKLSDMKDDFNYIICPDPTCNLFYTSTPLACEHRKCPQMEDMKKVIICGNCGEPIILDGDHDFFRRVEHDCADGRHPWMFSRMSGKYHIISGIKKRVRQLARRNI